VLVPWVRACHPGPTALVTIVVTALSWQVGWAGWPLLGVALAVLLGQLSIGWSNDAVDAAVDAEAARAAKPTVSDGVGARTLMTAALIVGTASLILSWVVAGPIGGTCHVIGVAMGWLYNLRLSRTAWAWLPYGIAFGLLPSFVYVGLDGTWPPAWLTIAFAVLGISAHLGNSLRDLDADSAIGLGGTASRLGRRRTRMLAWLLLVVGTSVVVWAVWPTSPIAALVGAIGVAVLLLATARLGDSRSFTGILAAAGVLAVVVIVAL
jgi:4-hydroxybenzoate polyprenyltransferase